MHANRQRAPNTAAAPVSRSTAGTCYGGPVLNLNRQRLPNYAAAPLDEKFLQRKVEADRRKAEMPQDGIDLDNCPQRQQR
jgi:hypothetical protein